MTRDFLGRRVLLTAPGPRAAEHGVHDGPGAVFFARPRVGADPQPDDGGRMPEDRPDLLDARTAGDEGGARKCRTSWVTTCGSATDLRPSRSAASSSSAWSARRA
ncbi:hypothetical protein ACFYXM_05215 [Streptomyces sp. NPDC002476]|uniref:hypothetical protein n=1 Tax=Streptomyces sp. NPDC002476 TaxID=3364648 RepID=UPI003696050E